MIGISKEKLANINPWVFETQQDLLNFILDECVELDPWLPIDENTPKDKPLVFYYPDSRDVAVVTWNKQHKFYVSTKAGKPTHYQELPDDPEPGDKNGDEKTSI